MAKQTKVEQVTIEIHEDLRMKPDEFVDFFAYEGEGSTDPSDPGPDAGDLADYHVFNGRYWK